MRAFAEDLTAKYRVVHLIRLGPAAVEYGDPWECSVCCGSNDGVTALLFGFSGKTTGDTPMAIARAAISAANRLGYRDVRWERKRPEGFHLVEVSAR